VPEDRIRWVQIPSPRTPRAAIPQFLEPGSPPGHRWAEYDVLGIGYRSSGCVRYAGGANLAADPDRLKG